MKKIEVKAGDIDIPPVKPGDLVICREHRMDAFFILEVDHTIFGIKSLDYRFRRFFISCGRWFSGFNFTIYRNEP